MDDKQKELLEMVRSWQDPGPPTWKGTVEYYFMIVAGVVFVVLGAAGGSWLNNSALGGFMIGAGLVAVLSFRCLGQRRTAFLLICQADEAGAFAKPNEAGDAT